jgi:C-terminal processing protease CtpA/Prc
MPVLQQYLMGGVGIAEITLTDDEQVVIVDVSDGSAAAQAGIQAGDVLISVDGVPAVQSLDETPLLITSASTVHGRRFLQAAIMLQGPIGSSVELVWRADGSDRRRTHPHDGPHRAVESVWRRYAHQRCNLGAAAELRRWLHPHHGLRH